MTRKPVGAKNPYALADYIDKKKKPKEWKKILVGLDLEFKDLETALRHSLKRKYEKLPDSLFDPENGSPLYEKDGE